MPCLSNSIVAIVVSAGAASLGGQVTFRTGVDLVNFGVTVLDRRGNFVTDLDEQDFEIYEEGQRQTLRVFARGDDDSNAPALHLGLLFDTSGSMVEDLKLSRTAAIKFLNTLTSAVDITLVDFDTEVRVARYGQADFPRLVERIRMREADGWTALYDALGVYLDGAAAQDGRKILVLYTDGGDTRSALSFHELQALIRASDATIYAIGFLEHQPSSVRSEQRMRLQQMVEMTGGQAFFPSSTKDLDGVFEKVLAEMRAQYSLGYLSSNPKTDGAWRKVEIKVRRPASNASNASKEGKDKDGGVGRAGKGARDLKIRTRKGYFAPYRESQERPDDHGRS